MSIPRGLRLQHCTHVGVNFLRPYVRTPPPCACCGDKLMGDIVKHTNCQNKVQTLCIHHGHCFKCVRLVCNEPPSCEMRQCKTCKNRVHRTCVVHVAFRVEVVSKTCTPRPHLASQPAKKYKRHFKSHWQVRRLGCNMPNEWCIACWEYPQPGVHVPCVKRPFEWKIHVAANLAIFCCVLRVTWCHLVHFSCYLRQNGGTINVSKFEVLTSRLFPHFRCCGVEPAANLSKSRIDSYKIHTNSRL